MTPSGPKKGIGIIIATPKDDGPNPLSSPEDQQPDEKMEPTEGDAHCGNCKFFEPATSYCVRFPPHGSEWSMVDENGYCGEWRGGPNHEPHDGGGASEQPGMPSAAPSLGGYGR